MSKLLINEHPLIILPKLAKAIGLNEAIFIQQTHYWVNHKNAPEFDNKKWHCATYESWLERICFWSESTLKRTIKSLREMNLIITRKMPNKHGVNVNWYTINYTELEKLETNGDFEKPPETPTAPMTAQNDRDPLVQDEPTKTPLCQNEPGHYVKLTHCKDNKINQKKNITSLKDNNIIPRAHAHIERKTYQIDRAEVDRFFGLCAGKIARRDIAKLIGVYGSLMVEEKINQFVSKINEIKHPTAWIYKVLENGDNNNGGNISKSKIEARSNDFSHPVQPNLSHDEKMALWASKCEIEKLRLYELGKHYHVSLQFYPFEELNTNNGALSILVDVLYDHGLLIANDYRNVQETHRNVQETQGQQVSAIN